MWAHVEEHSNQVGDSYCEVSQSFAKQHLHTEKQGPYFSQDQNALFLSSLDKFSQCNLPAWTGVNLLGKS